MKCKNNEDFVHQLVINGDLTIDGDGFIWRVRKRLWDSGHRKAVSRPCKRVRAEHDQGKYFQVRAMIDGKRIYCLAHRLVWRTFIGPIPDGLTINHEDGRKKHNRLDNLELATYSEQHIHAIHVLRVGHAAHQSGIANNMAKLTEEDIPIIRARRKSGETLITIASDYSVTYQTIHKICIGSRWNHISD